MPTIEQLKELISAKLNPDEILDILGWTTYELVEALEEDIEFAYEEFVKATDDL